jgi:hypothetical protein
VTFQREFVIGEKATPQIQAWSARKKFKQNISGLVCHIPQLLRATQPENPRKVISKKIFPYAYGKFCAGISKEI